MNREDWNKAYANRIHQRSGMDVNLARESAKAADDAFADAEDPIEAADEEMSCWDAD